MSKGTIFRLEWRPLTANGSVWQLSLPFKDGGINEAIAVAVKNTNSSFPWIVHILPGLKSMMTVQWPCKPTNEQVLTYG